MKMLIFTETKKTTDCKIRILMCLEVRVWKGLLSFSGLSVQDSKSE